MTEVGASETSGARLVHEPLHEVLGPAPATGHLVPPAVNVGVGVGFTVAQSAYPSGVDLEVMERLHPGAMGRILAMSETAQQAQIKSTSDAMTNARADMKRGQWLGASLTTIAIVIGAAEGVWGSTVVAVAILGVPVFSAVRSVVESARRK